MCSVTVPVFHIENYPLSSLESLHSSVDSLKAQSTGSFAVFEEAKASVGDVGELRQLIKDTLGGHLFVLAFAIGLR